MRTRLWAIGVGSLLLTGCGAEAEAKPHRPAPIVDDVPASAAGGACYLLDFGMIEQTTGSRFEVSVATQQEQTFTCLARGKTEARPDLVLSVTATSADAAIFKDEVVPRGAQQVKGLGKAAYRVVVPAVKGQGPGVEVGWLTGDDRLMSLRYTLAQGQDQTSAAELTPKLVTLAEQIDYAGM
ncbi:hypothetical protein [Micromonospora sp. NPDC049679]|uniref:hypothetical protein n=1 Tax=Micromonospora sp. NPDC049679 TaxID=3155920 RepID=UPI0033EE2602